MIFYKITIYNIPEQESRATPRTVILRVSQQGNIVVPLGGELNVKGRTVAEVQEEVQKRYSKYIQAHNRRSQRSPMHRRDRLTCRFLGTAVPLRP